MPKFTIDYPDSGVFIRGHVLFAEAYKKMRLRLATIRPVNGRPKRYGLLIGLHWSAIQRLMEDFEDAKPISIATKFEWKESLS